MGRFGCERLYDVGTADFHKHSLLRDFSFFRFTQYSGYYLRTMQWKQNQTLLEKLSLELNQRKAKLEPCGI